MTKAEQEHLARALETLAASIAAAPRNVIGTQISVTAGPGASGIIKGMEINVTGGPGSGDVTGFRSTVTAGGPDPAAELVKELREAAAAVREDKAHKGWLTSLVTRVKALTDRAVDAAALALVVAAIKAVFG